MSTHLKTHRKTHHMRNGEIDHYLQDLMMMKMLVFDVNINVNVNGKVKSLNIFECVYGLYLMKKEWVKLIGNCMVYNTDVKTVVISREPMTFK